MALNYEETLTDHGLRNPRSGRGGLSQSGFRASQVVSLRNPYNRKAPQHLKVATWNVRSMYQSGKVHNVVKEMKRLNIDIMGISETHWPDSGQCEILGYTVYHSGNNASHHRNGTAVIVAPHINRAVKTFVPDSDRAMLLQIRATPVDLNIIQIYAPTADKDEQTIEEFYQELHVLNDMTKKHEVTLIMGDFNAKVGKGSVENTVGNFGLGERNDRGDRLIRFCQEHDLILSNTLFKLPPRRIYTWKSPADSPGNVVRNQIDYITVPTRFKNTIKSAKTYPGADVASDHNPVVCRLVISVKRLQRKPRSERIDIKKLADPDTEMKVQECLQNEMMKTMENPTNRINTWNGMRDAIQLASTTFLKQETMGKKEWMTREILDLMEVRRHHKNRNNAKYRETQEKIRKLVRTTKEKWLSEKCREIEECQRKYDSYNMHKKIKEMTTKVKGNKTTMSIIDNNGNFISEEARILETWEMYVRQLFDSDRSDNYTCHDTSTGPCILESEVENAIMTLKNNKAPGPDQIHGEMLKFLCRMDNRILPTLTAICNIIYDSGEIPEEWLQSTFIAIPKKPNAKICDQYRLISLINHMTKVFTKIIHNRIYRKCEVNLSESQFAFRNAMGTREAIFSLQVLIQRCRDVNKDVYLGFIDFSKAFDNIKHEQLLKILKTAGIDDKDIRIIRNMYWGQSAKVKINNTLTETIRIKKGVRQGCILSPLLFNIYSEEIFKEALEDAKGGIAINGEIINNLRYADDTVLLANNMDELQHLLQKLNETSNAYGLDLNIGKTKWMVVSKNQLQTNRQLMVGNRQIERVNSYTYLGTTLNASWDQSTEIRSRIEKARAAYNSMRNIFRNNEINIPLKIRLAKCYVFSVLLYGVEAWTLTEALLKKLEAFEMWLYRRILKIPWTEHVSNVEVLRRINKDTEVVLAVKRRKLEYLGHVMRNNKYKILQLIIQGKVDGRRGPGRRRHSWLQNLRKWYGVTSVQLFRSAANRIRLALMIANVRNG